MDEFLADFPEGLEAGRYVSGELPSLPFGDKSFDLALCSHFLFLYSEQLSLEYHLNSIRELCRVAKQVRLFPLVELGSRDSRHVPEVMKRLSLDGFSVEILPVISEFQKRGNKMMIVTEADGFA